MIGATVLVVDDDPTISAFVGAALEDAGYRVVSAVDGAAVDAACSPVRCPPYTRA